MPARYRLASLVLLLGVACAGPPSEGAGTRDDAEHAVSLTDPSVAPPEPAADPEPRPAARAEPPEPAGEDALLAKARASMRAGRVPASVRDELAGSGDPVHRRAARMLRAIDEGADAVRVRLPDPSMAAVEPVVAAEPIVLPPRPVVLPEPGTLSEPAPASAPEDPTVTASELPDAPLDLRRLDPRSLAAAWFANAPEVAPSVEAPPFDLRELLRDDDPLVLLEDPPSSGALLRAILTRIELTPAGEGMVVALVGSAAVSVRAQPLPGQRLRVRLEPAGAVPAFVAARPEAGGVAVVDVRRGRGHVDLELELASDWTLLAVRSRDNGAELELGLPAE